jgi:hypothetical protein
MDSFLLKSYKLVVNEESDNESNNSEEDEESKYDVAVVDCKIDIFLYSNTNYKSDLQCISSRDNEFTAIRSRHQENYMDLNKFQIYKYFSVIMNPKITLGFSKKQFMSYFENTPFKSDINAILSEKNLQSYLNLSNVKCLCPVIRNQTLYDTILSSNHNNDNNDNNHDETENNGNENNDDKKPQNKDVIIPIILLPYILINFPETLKKINDIHEIIAQNMVKLFNLYKKEKKSYIQDYYLQYQSNWLDMIKKNEIKLSELQRYMMETTEMRELLNVLMESNARLTNEVNNLKIKIESLNGVNNSNYSPQIANGKHGIEINHSNNNNNKKRKQ